MRAWRPTVLVAAIVATAAVPAAGFVNPDFTPHIVHRQYKLICQASIPPIAEDARAVTLVVDEMLKGEQFGKTITLDLARALAGKDGPAEVKGLLSLLKGASSPTAVVFVPGPEAQVPSVLMHVDGTWLRASLGDKADVCHFEKIDTWLNGTFNGGTDMLADTMRFIARHPDVPMMPVDIGVKWDLHEKVGRAPGKVSALNAVDVNGDGKLDVHVVCPAGDRVFLARDKGFEELAGLASASLAADWADFDGDGRADLASLAADGLKLWLQAEPGKFRMTPIELPAKPDTACPTVHAADLDGDGRADLVISLGPLPVVLRNQGQGRFAAEGLSPADKEFLKQAGLPGPAVVADFDSDGFPDILQPMQKNGLLFAGGRGGKLAAGVACGVAMGDVKRRMASVADFAGDGALGVYLVGGGQRPVLFIRRGGRFEPVTRYLGEPSYIVQAGAGCASSGDANNDGFVDLFVGYETEESQCFFNRGFRSLAIAESLKLPREELSDVDKGQSAVLWADMDGDGSMDLLTALAGGDVYLSQTNLGAMKSPIAIIVRLGSRSPVAGPVTATFHAEGRCLGARVVAGRFSQPAEMGLPLAGEYLVKWKLPGQPEQSRKVTVIDRPVTVTIGE